MTVLASRTARIMPCAGGLVSPPPLSHAPAAYPPELLPIPRGSCPSAKHLRVLFPRPPHPQQSAVSTIPAKPRAQFHRQKRTGRNPILGRVARVVPRSN